MRVPDRAPVQRVQVQPEREQQQVRAQQARLLPELALQGQEQAQQQDKGTDRSHIRHNNVCWS